MNCNFCPYYAPNIDRPSDGICTRDDVNVVNCAPDDICPKGVIPNAAPPAEFCSECEYYAESVFDKEKGFCYNEFVEPWIVNPNDKCYLISNPNEMY